MKSVAVPRNLSELKPRLCALAVAACFTGSAGALPNAPVVAAGRAAVSVQGRTLTVTNTPGAVINWGGFSIRADELARFQQHSAASSVLNRVVGQDPSAILGQLQSNGRVFVINPNGIVFGPSARIDVAGLVASSLHLSSADFLAGRMQFREQGVSGSVVNQGEIRTPAGGQVFLVAPRVENHGLITTPGGDIILAAGKKISIVDAANPSMRIELAAPENEALNLGKLVAAGGRINMLGSALRVSGRVGADAAVIENGKVALRRTPAPARDDVAGTVNLKATDALTLEAGASVTADGPVAGKVSLESGGELALQLDTRVSASGAIGGAVAAKAETGTLIAQGVVEATGSDGPGGSVRFQGNRVALLQRSRTDASGTEGGGVVLVGGGFQGSDASMQNAQKTVVASGAEIRVDATRAGDGGMVVVWSDEATRYYGSISARGAGEGKGGFVEVSGKRHLDFAGRVDLSAQSGRSGTLLLDPLNINLTTTDVNTANFTAPGDILEEFTGDAGLTSNFNVSAGGSFAGITGNSAIVLQATNNITASTAFNITAATGNSDVSLTLQANNSIAINAAITTGGTGNLTLIADNDGVGGGAISRTAAGTLSVGAGGTITLNAATGLNASVSAPSVSVTNRTSGAVTVTNNMAGGTVAFAGNVAASGITVTTSNGAVTQTGAINASGTSTFNAGTAGDVTLANASNNFGTVAVTSAREVQVADANAIILGASTIAGNLALTANGTVTQSAAIAVAGTANVQAGTNNITLATATNNFNVVHASGQAVNLRDANAMTLGNVSATAALTLQTGGVLDQAGGATLTAGGNTTLTAGAGNNITLANAGNDFNVVRIVSGNNVTLTDANALSFGGGASTVSGALTLNANGALTQVSSVAVAGLATFNIGAANDLTLGNTANAFANVSILSAGNATLFEAGGFDLAASSVANNLTLTSTGAITDSGNLTVPGRLTVETRNNAAAAITLDSAGNNFGSVSAQTMNGTGATVVAGAITLREASAMDLALLRTNGAATLTAAGALTQSGQVAVGTTLTANVGAANDVTLANASNNFGTVAVTSAREVQVADANAIILGASTIAGNLALTANGAVTQSAAIAVAGTANVQAGTNNITLATAGNNFNVVHASGQAVSLLDANTMTLGNVAATGALTLSTAGLMSQAAGATLTAGGNTTLTAGAGNNITLANAGNDFNVVRIVSGNNVTLTDANALSFGGGASTVSGALTLNANGALTQVSSVAVAGLATFNIGAANDLTLGNTANAFANVSILSAGNATLFEAGGFDLAASSVANNLTLTSTGAITDSGNLTVPGRLTVETRNNAAAAITLDSAGNNFGSVSAQTMNGTGATVVAGAITLREASAMDLALLRTNGAATLTAAGALTQSGQVAVGTTLTANVGAANDVTLANASNNFGTVAVTSAREVQVADANAIILGASTIAGNLALTANGAVTQSAAIAVAGTANVQAGTNNITLATAGNNFNVVHASGQAVSLLDANTMTLGNVAATGALTLSTAGLMSQAAGATLTAGGNTTLTAGAGNNITLANAGNDFNVVRIVSGNNVTLTDANALSFGGGASTVSGALTLNANGALTQVSSVAVAGLATFNIGAANDLTLGNTANNFGSVTLLSAANATIADANAITLNAGTLDGALSVSSVNNTITVAGNLSTAAANGAISFNAGTGTYVQNANIDVGAGAGNITVSANTLTLNANAGNDALQTSGSLTLRPGAIATTISIAGASTFDVSAAELNAIMPGLNNAGGSLIIGRTDSTAAMTIGAAYNFGAASEVTLAAGSLTDANTTNRVLSGGSLALYSNSGAIGGAANNAIDVSVANLNLSSNGQNAFVASTGPVNFGYGNSSLGAGNLTVTSAGAITQAANTAIVASGTATFSPGAANSVTLNNADNNFATVAVTAGNVILRDVDSITLAAGNVGGALGVTANGTIGQSGALTVAGTATLNAGAGDITLTNAGNNFGTVAASGNSVALRDSNAIQLGTTNAASTLAVTANGAITQSGTIATGGTASFDTTAAAALGNVSIASGGTLELGNATAGGSAVLSSASGNVNLAGGQTLTVVGALSTSAAGTSNLAGTLRLGGAQVQTDAGGTTLAASGAGANFDLSSVSLPGSGNVAINLTSQVTTFNGAAIGGTAILLNNANNSFGGAVIFTTAAAAVASGPTATTYNLVQTAPLSLPAQALAVANGGNVTLTNGTNNLSTLSLANVSSASVVNGGALALGNVSTPGALSVQSGGAMTQLAGSSIATGGNTTLTAGAANDITLANAGNDFGNLRVVSARDVTLRDANALAFGGGGSTVSGNLGVTSNGAITQSSALAVAGAATFNAGSADIALNQPLNAFSSLGVASANNADIANGGGLVLRASAVLGSLTVSAVGAVTQTGALTVAGAASFNTGANVLTLDHAGNDFSSVQVASAGNASITDANAMALAGANVNGTLSLKTSGALSQTGAVVASGIVTIDAGAGGNVTLTHAANNFAVVRVNAANNVSLVDAGAIDLGAFSVNGAIMAEAGGDVSLSGVLQAAGAGNAIVIATGGNFLNSGGAAALSTTSGRWLVYSADPALNVFGGLASGNSGLWSHTHGANPPATVVQPGNRYLFSAARVVTVSGTNLTKTYGDDATAAVPTAFIVSGLNTNTFGGAMLADIAANALSGAPVLASAGAAAAAPVTGSPYAITIGAGTLAAPNGYTLAIGGAGQLVVLPARLIVRASDAARLTGEPNPSFTATYAGFRRSDGPASLAGVLHFATAATQASFPGNYPVTPFGVTSPNYTISFSGGTLRVSQAPFIGDPLQGAHNALFTPSSFGLTDFRTSSPASTPLFVLAAADVPFEELLRGLAPTAATSQDTMEPRPRFRSLCDTSTPWGLLRCRLAR